MKPFLIESTFSLEDSPQDVAELAAFIKLNPDNKIEVLLSLMKTFHDNIGSWSSRSYQGATWAVGIHCAVVSYLFIHADKNTLAVRIVVSCGLLMLGIMMQLYLRAASRAHSGNRLGIAKCEAALGLYEEGEYLKGRSFFLYSKEMRNSKNLQVITIFHFIVAVLSILLVLFSEFLTK